MTYIKGFDGIRAVSIILVILTHLGLYKKLQGYDFLQENFNLYSGTTGVIIFFSISGFLITSLLLKEKNATGKINFKFFFIKRLLRLAPPLLIFLSIILILMLGNLIPENYIGLVFAFFYLYNFVPFLYYVVELGHTWSLGVEEQYYLVWPFFLTQIIKIKYRLFLCAIVLMMCITWKMTYTYQVNFITNRYSLAEYFFLDRMFIPACLPIMIGSMTGMILFEYKSYLLKLFNNNYLLLILSIFLYTAQIYFHNFSPFLIDIFVPISVSIFLLWVYFNQESFIVTLLEIKPISFTGKISYGIYVYQGLFLRTGPGGKLLIQHFPLNIFLLFVTAILSYILVESKILKYKLRYRSYLRK